MVCEGLNNNDVSVVSRAWDEKDRTRQVEVGRVTDENVVNSFQDVYIPKDLQFEDYSFFPDPFNKEKV